MSSGASAEAAQRLLRVLEEERAKADGRIVLDAVADRLRPGIARWIGSEGWDALVARGRAEAAASPPADDVDARTLISVADLLTRLLGPLALRLIEQACAAPDPRPGRRAHHG